MGYAKLEPVFSNVRELPMSPYNTCTVELDGPWAPDLPDYRWQDLFAKSDNNRYLALVAWDMDGCFNPGFRLVVIDKRTKTVREARRVAGCCDAISWDASGFEYKTFGFLSENVFSELVEVV